MEDPAMTWAIFAVVWGACLFRDGYRRGRRAAQPPPVPCPPVFVVSTPPAAAPRPERPPRPLRVPQPVAAPADDRRWVTVGGRDILVEASAIRDL
jgi:hypothetical protein